MTKPALLLLAFFQVITYIPSRDAQYIGGTASAIPTGTIGALDATDDKALLFKWEKTRRIEAGEWHISYNKVTYLGYGQHAGRRVGAAAGSAATIIGAPAAAVLLFTKKRRHYLTIHYTDDQSKSQAAIFLVGKKVIRPTLKTLESKTGKRVEYEDEEARATANK